MKSVLLFKVDAQSKYNEQIKDLPFMEQERQEMKLLNYRFNIDALTQMSDCASK